MLFRTLSPSHHKRLEQVVQVIGLSKIVKIIYFSRRNGLLRADWVFLFCRGIFLYMDAYQIIWGTFWILALILIPGVAVTMALYPRKDQIGLAERLGLGLVFGLLPQFFLYFMSNNFSVPVTTDTTILFISLVTAAGLGVWYKRKVASTEAAPQ